MTNETCRFIEVGDGRGGVIVQCADCGKVQVPEYVSSETVQGDEDSRLNLSFNIRVF